MKATRLPNLKKFIVEERRETFKQINKCSGESCNNIRITEGKQRRDMPCCPGGREKKKYLLTKVLKDE